MLLLAGLVMVAVLFPLDAFFLHAGDRATAPGLLLLALEAVLGLTIYAGILHLLIPGALAELRGLFKKMELRGLLRGCTRSRPGDDLREQQRQAAIKTRVLARDLFDQMSEAEQDEALGPDLAKAVRNGEVELGDLVTAEAALGRAAPWRSQS